jgi:hypothetical protein
MLIPNQSTTLITYRPFGNTFQRNLRLLKPCAVIKCTRWLKNNSSQIRKPPTPYNINSHITSQLARLAIAANIAMSWVGIPVHIVMWVLGLVHE